ncbi:c-type cytochrome [Propionivibrio sp.]|jgi:cytochrome c|uniref:c-type cytochrome n=1 Tax=Propionivibrio sp. TaxID=2212460 RepID=UPI0039E56433
MKTTHLSLLLAAGVLVSGPVLADEALAKAKGCLACHTVDKKLIGPTYKEVAKKYAGQKGAEAKVAETIVKGTPVPAGAGWQKEGKATLPFMPPNTTVKPDEADKLAKWILGLK